MNWILKIKGENMATKFTNVLLYGNLAMIKSGASELHAYVLLRMLLTRHKYLLTRQQFL